MLISAFSWRSSSVTIWYTIIYLVPYDRKSIQLSRYVTLIFVIIDANIYLSEKQERMKNGGAQNARTLPEMGLVSLAWFGVVSFCFSFGTGAILKENGFLFFKNCKSNFYDEYSIFLSRFTSQASHSTVDCLKCNNTTDSHICQRIPMIIRFHLMYSLWL